MNAKPIMVPRLHEQREHWSKKTIEIKRLRKRMLVEVLDWDDKTERVKIHKRMRLKDYQWTEDKDYKYLTLNLKNVDLKEDKKIKVDIIEQIMSKHSETLKYSLVNRMVEGMKKHEKSGMLIGLDELEKKLKEKTKDKDGQIQDEFHFHIAHEKV